MIELPNCYRCGKQPCECRDGASFYYGDCLEVMQAMEADSVSAIVCDPPYGLKFMGKSWDHSVPGVPSWRAALRVAKPGAPLLAFGGTRTHHRLMCAIEDAGWEIRDCLMWLYGSGFPKSHNISKAIDKAAGAEREVVGFSQQQQQQRTPGSNTSAYGDTGTASRFFYCAKASKAERGKDNTHPTVKPLDLMFYLCRLVSMPEHKGTLLDPFAGSGSTLLAATRWFERCIGIENDESSCKIAANRLRQEVRQEVLF